MAITQERIIGILNAAQDYQQALQRLSDAIKDATGPQAQGSPEDRLSMLSMQSQIVMLLKDPLRSAAILESERVYFKRNARRNIAAAKWQANERRLAKLGIKREKKTYKPDKPTQDSRPHAPDPASMPTGAIRVIKPGERTDLDLEIEQFRAIEGLDEPGPETEAGDDSLVEAEEGQEAIE